MDKRKLNEAFRIIKIAAKLDYAITNADNYGDCQSCVNYALCEAFGVESKGIWTKHWLKGMNKGRPWKELDEVYIGHDITEGQAEIIVQILERYDYKVEPREYNPHECFVISERKYKTVEFRSIDEHTIFKIGKEEFVKRPFKEGYNAFNLATGEPRWVNVFTLCEVKEESI